MRTSSGSTSRTRWYSLIALSSAPLAMSLEADSMTLFLSIDPGLGRAKGAGQGKRLTLSEKLQAGQGNRPSRTSPYTHIFLHQAEGERLPVVNTAGAGVHPSYTHHTMRPARAQAAHA